MKALFGLFFKLIQAKTYCDLLDKETVVINLLRVVWCESKLVE